MISHQSLEKIKETVQEFFQKADFEVDAEILALENEIVSIKIKMEDPKVLIGKNGQTLSDIQHLLKAILRHKIDEHFYLDVDVNDYKKKKIEYLKETVRSLADEVVLTKKEQTLAPMSAYERRIVHLELAHREDITTQSIGEGPERRIVIRPA